MNLLSVSVKDKLPKCLNKTKFCKIEELKYKNGTFEAGLVRHSPHKSNTVYLRQGELVTHLRNDEAVAIIRCLSMALWCHDIFIRNGMPKLKWEKYGVAE
jgi:hypothetical protein